MGCFLILHGSFQAVQKPSNSPTLQLGDTSASKLWYTPPPILLLQPGTSCYSNPDSQYSLGEPRRKGDSITVKMVPFEGEEEKGKGEEEVYVANYNFLFTKYISHPNICC